MEQTTKLLNKTYLTLKDLQQSPIWSELQVFVTSNISAPRQILYHYVNNITSIPLCLCGNELKWHSERREYRTYCSKKCTAVHSVDRIKLRNLETIGVEWHTQTSEWAAKVKSTCMQKYGVEHYSRTAEFTDRVKSTNLNKFGVEYPIQNKAIQSQIAATCFDRFGVANPLSNKHIQAKIQQTNLQKFKVVNPLSSPDIQSKVKQTNLTRYGHVHPAQNDAIAKKIASTRIRNYYTPGTLDKLNDPVWLAEQQQTMTVSEISKLLNVSHSNVCKHFHRHNIKIVYHSTTELERKLFGYFANRQISVELNNRTIIAPKEIDIVFPEAQLGIEINGGYWHSDQFHSDANSHLNKTIACAAAGIELWQFWDWELNSNWDLIISKIQHRLNLSTRYFARKLQLNTVSHNEKQEFLKINHIQGSCPSSVNIGLYQNDELLMIGTFGKSRFTKKAQWELLRLCCKQGLSVAGGASKIISNFVNNYMKTNDVLISYCHRRFSQGQVYNSTGFTLSHVTSPGYVYVKSGVFAGSRQQWQKHKLESKLDVYDVLLTEEHNMKANGYYRLWDCGQYVFTLSKC